MWKKVFTCSLLLIFIGMFEISLAAGTSSVNVIGFSKDGKYIAYEVTFYDDMAGTGFKKIRFVDVPANRFVKTLTLWDENERVGNNEKIQKQIDYNLFKYRIIKQNKGKRVFWDDTFMNPSHYQLPHAREKIIRDVIIRKEQKDDKKNIYQVSLKEIEINQSICFELNKKEGKPKIFELAVLIQDSLKVLQKDTKLFRSRRCPYAYGIHQIIKYGNKIVVFLDSWTMGSEGPNIHKLIVTGKFP